MADHRSGGFANRSLGSYYFRYSARWLGAESRLHSAAATARWTFPRYARSRMRPLFPRFRLNTSGTRLTWNSVFNYSDETNYYSQQHSVSAFPPWSQAQRSDQRATSFKTRREDRTSPYPISAARATPRNFMAAFNRTLLERTPKLRPVQNDPQDLLSRCRFRSSHPTSMPPANGRARDHGLRTGPGRPSTPTTWPSATPPRRTTRLFCMDGSTTSAQANPNVSATARQGVCRHARRSRARKKWRSEFAADILKKFGAASLMGTRIYFVSDRTGHKEIWSMNYDGSDQKQFTSYRTITNFPGGFAGRHQDRIHHLSDAAVLPQARVAAQSARNRRISGSPRSIFIRSKPGGSWSTITSRPP